MYLGKCLERRTNDLLKDRYHFQPQKRKSVKFYCVEFHTAIYKVCNVPSSFSSLLHSIGTDTIREKGLFNSIGKIAPFSYFLK